MVRVILLRIGYESSGLQRSPECGQIVCLAAKNHLNVFAGYELMATLWTLLPITTLFVKFAFLNPTVGTVRRFAGEIEHRSIVTNPFVSLFSVWYWISYLGTPFVTRHGYSLVRSHSWSLSNDLNTFSPILFLLYIEKAARQPRGLTSGGAITNLIPIDRMLLFGR